MRYFLKLIGSLDNFERSYWRSEYARLDSLGVIDMRASWLM